MTEAGAPSTGPYYLCAEDADGFASGGIDIGSAAYPASDAYLGTKDSDSPNDYDESQTEGNDGLGTPAAPTAILKATPTAGDLDNGDHYFRIVNVAYSDVYKARTLIYTPRLWDVSDGELKGKWPGVDLIVTEV